MDTLLLVSKDPIAGKAYDLGLLPRRNLKALLAREFLFKSGNHVSINGLCKEITRATGKRVEWLPDDEKLLSDLTKHWYGDVSLPPPSVGEASAASGPLCFIPFGAVLEYLASLCTDAERDMNWPDCAIWTAWVASDVILLVRLPKKHFSSPDEVRYFSVADRTGAADADSQWSGLKTATVVLPSNSEAGIGIDPSEVADPNWVAPYLPAAPPPREQKSRLAEVVNLRVGSYSTRGLAQEIARASGMAVQWMPMWFERSGTGRPFVEHDDRFRVVASDSRDTQHGLALASQVRLEDALAYLLERITESGPGFNPPDREVWVAWISDNAIFLISLPDAQ